MKKVLKTLLWSLSYECHSEAAESLWFLEQSKWSDWEKSASQFLEKPGLPIKGSAGCEAMILSRTICTLLLLIPPATLVSEELVKWEENDTQRFGEKDKAEEKVKGRLTNTEWKVNWKRQDQRKTEEIGSKWSKEKDTGIRSEKTENLCLLVLAMILKILKIFPVTLPVLTDLSARELLLYIAAF